MLSGTLPTEVAHCSLLDTLQFGYSPISGSLPSQIGTLLQLKFLVGFDSLLSGTIPEELYNASSLQHFVFGLTFLQGTISSRIGLLEDLKTFLVEEAGNVG